MDELLVKITYRKLFSKEEKTVYFTEEEKDDDYFIKALRAYESFVKIIRIERNIKPTSEHCCA